MPRYLSVSRLVILFGNLFIFSSLQDPNVFDLVQMGKTKALLKLIAKSQKERDDWVKDIKTCKSGLAQQKDNKEKSLSFFLKSIPHLQKLI